jgi:predicted AAA+ superfamily ATPase
LYKNFKYRFMVIQKFKPRQQYIERIKPYLSTSLIKVIVGQRRVGKSFFLYQLIDVIKKNDKLANIIYINKELFDFDAIKDYTNLMTYFLKNKKEGVKNYLFIDEIQEIVAFEKCLRSIQAKNEAEIFITGSNSDLLSSELSTYLSGRYVEMKIFGLSYNEFLQFHSLENSETSFYMYLKFGGLPELIHINLEDNTVFDYLRNIYAAILFKDVVKRNNIRNISFLENLIKFVGDNVGSIFSAKKISDYLKSQQIKVTPNIVMDYLAYLENAFFIFKVQRSDLVGKRIFEIGEKFYFEDLGLRHSLIGYRQNDINKILENIVFIHLKMVGYTVTIGCDNGKEIDFICERKSEKLYIQVAYILSDENVRNREFGNLLSIQNNYPKMVISMDKSEGSTYQGIIHKNIINFIAELV